MSKAVLISIQPKWCEKIANGEKTVEIRKTCPKLGTSFKCYIYCTKPKFPHEDHITLFDKQRCFYAGGLVIGEFVCDRIICFGNVATDSWKHLQGSTHEEKKRIVAQNACLTEDEMLSYRGKYGWYISNLMIYDKPKDLSEFVGLRETKFGFAPTPIIRAPQSWRYVKELYGGVDR